MRDKKRIKFEEYKEIPAVYIIDGIYRRVEPYNFTYITFAKERWYNKTILQVFSNEFRDKSIDYYKHAIETGDITVNDKQISIDYIFKNSDKLMHKTHRHEPPVTSNPLKIIHESETLVVIDKPASIPVHPTGRYRHNTVVNILQSEYKISPLFPIHRIDRLTSGLLIIAKTKQKSKELGEDMTDRAIQKTYIAKVHGLFPQSLVCNEPIRTLSHKMTINIVAPDGKPCSTMFKLLKSGDGFSIVECKPLTGRTHQIRVHLLFLGFPIMGDPLYNFESLYQQGEVITKQDNEEVEVVIKDIKHTEQPKQFEIIEIESHTDQIKKKPRLETLSNDEKEDKSKDLPEQQDTINTNSHLLNYNECVACSHPYSDPLPENQMIYLHAWEYSAKNWSFQSDLPHWAQ